MSIAYSPRSQVILALCFFGTAILLCGCPDYSALREAPDYSKMSDSGDEPGIEGGKRTETQPTRTTELAVANPSPNAAVTPRRPVNRRSSSSGIGQYLIYGAVLALIPLVGVAVLKWTPIFKKEASSANEKSAPTKPAPKKKSVSTSRPTTPPVTSQSIPQELAVLDDSDAFEFDDSDVILDDDSEFELNMNGDAISNDQALDLNQYAADESDDEFDLLLDADESMSDMDLQLPTTSKTSPLDNKPSESPSSTQQLGENAGITDHSHLSSSPELNAGQVISNSMRSLAASHIIDNHNATNANPKDVDPATENHALREELDRVREQNRVLERKLDEKSKIVEEIHLRQQEIKEQQAALEELTDEELRNEVAQLRLANAALDTQLEQTTEIKRRLRAKLRAKLNLIRKIAPVTN
ncbi:MAG: hypothetical protein AAFN77_00615 [Planctomycetota bacterium]